MTVMHTKKEAVYPLDSYEGLTQSLKLAIASSLWNATNRAKIVTPQQLLEFLTTVTQERLESLPD